MWTWGIALCSAAIGALGAQPLPFAEDFEAAGIDQARWDYGVPEGTDGRVEIVDGALRVLSVDRGFALSPRVELPPWHVVEFDYYQPADERHGGYRNSISCEVATKAPGIEWNGAAWYIEEGGGAWSHYRGVWAPRAQASGGFPPALDRWFHVRAADLGDSTVISVADRDTGAQICQVWVPHDPIVSGRLCFSAGAYTEGSRWGFWLDNLRVSRADATVPEAPAPLASAGDWVPPAAWQPQAIAGRSFWHLAEYQPETWERWGLQDHPLFAEAAWLHAPPDEALLAGCGKPFTMEPSSDPATRERQVRIAQQAGDRFLGFYGLELGPGGPLNEWGDGLIRQDLGDRFGGPIADRDDGLRRLRKLYEDLADTAPVPRAALALDGYRVFHHHAFRWGAQSVIAEVGENIPCTSLQIAAARGAGREFGKPWGIDLSSWFAGMVTDYRWSPDYLTAQSGPFSGHSASLHKRLSYAAWLGGANALWFENRDLLTVADNDVRQLAGYDGDSVNRGYRLSPVGEMAEHLFSLARAEDRGVPYTPVAVLLDFAHGWSPKGCAPHQIWGRLPFTEADSMLDEFFNTIYAWNPSRGYEGEQLNAYQAEGEQGYLAETPFGDLFDVLTTETCETLGGYRAVILVGDVRIGPELADRLRQYVADGGTLVINARQVGPSLPEGLLGARLTGETRQAAEAVCTLDGETMASGPFDYAVLSLDGARPMVTTPGGADVLASVHEVGRGRVVLTTPSYLLDTDRQALPLLPHLLGHLCSGLTPVRVSPGVGYTVNRTADGWVIGLFNNRGVYKKPLGLPTVRPEETARVAVSLTGRVRTVEEWVAGEAPEVEADGESTYVRLGIPPGDVRVLHVVEEGASPPRP